MVEPVPTQTADKVAEAIKELRHLVTCRCEPPWTERDMHNTTCVSEYADDLDVVEAAFGLVRTQVIAEAADAIEADEAILHPWGAIAASVVRDLS